MEPAGEPSAAQWSSIWRNSRRGGPESPGRIRRREAVEALAEVGRRGMDEDLERLGPIDHRGPPCPLRVRSAIRLTGRGSAVQMRSRMSSGGIDGYRGGLSEVLRRWETHGDG